MSDIKIVSTADLHGTVADWKLLPNGNLDESEELANYAKVALMTDRISDPDEVRPDPDSTDRRGWWGDMDAQAIWGGWPIGTKNWLLTKAKINDFPSWEGATVARAENYTRESLQPLIDLRFCSAINVKASRVAIDRIDVSVVFYRGNLPDIELIFQDLWNKLTVSEVRNPFGFAP